MLTDFHWNEAKKKFGEKKYKSADSKKLRFSTPPILNIFFKKMSGIGLWVNRIN